MAVVTIEGISSLYRILPIAMSILRRIRFTPIKLRYFLAFVLADSGPPLLIHQLIAFSAPFEIKRKGEIRPRKRNGLRLLSCQGSELPSPKIL